MKTNSKKPLAKGQVWSTGVADIEILGLGESYVHYKVTAQLGRKHISAQVSGIEPMRNYLEANEARLIKGSANN